MSEGGQVKLQPVFVNGGVADVDSFTILEDQHRKYLLYVTKDGVLACEALAISESIPDLERFANSIKSKQGK